MVTVSRSEAERFNNIPIIAVMGVQSPHIRQNGTAPGAITPSHNTGKSFFIILEKTSRMFGPLQTRKRLCFAISLNMFECYVVHRKAKPNFGLLVCAGNAKNLEFAFKSPVNIFKLFFPLSSFSSGFTQARHRTRVSYVLRFLKPHGCSTNLFQSHFVYLLQQRTTAATVLLRLWVATRIAVQWSALVGGWSLRRLVLAPDTMQYHPLKAAELTVIKGAGLLQEEHSVIRQLKTWDLVSEDLTVASFLEGDHDYLIVSSLN